ncbi:hypothetical protein PROFUN_00430 [Planoprotostelium fungivorum]|uniref:Uncharacterized protein n=1 Tax=Planoprotostelium fungivorum TaxID=1890364 RepID=A0A2P6N0T4_9EUKA|nr:hypothetical protein PROFUN_00430 [Planoprotostelium fungivorum]
MSWKEPVSGNTKCFLTAPIDGLCHSHSAVPHKDRVSVGDLRRTRRQSTNQTKICHLRFTDEATPASNTLFFTTGMRYPLLTVFLGFLLFLGASADLPSVTLSLLGVQPGSTTFPKGDVGHIKVNVSGSVDWALCPLFINITISGKQLYSIPYNGEGSVSFPTPLMVSTSETYAQMFAPTPLCFSSTNSYVRFLVRNTAQKQSYSVTTSVNNNDIVDASRNGYFRLNFDETPLSSCNVTATFQNFNYPSRTYISNFIVSYYSYSVYLESQLNSGNYTILVSSSNCNLTYPTPTQFTSLWSLSVSQSSILFAQSPIFLSVSPRPTSSCPTTFFLYDQSDKLMSQKTVSNYSDNNQLTFPEQAVGVYRLEWTCPAECFFSCSVRNHTVVMPITTIDIYRSGKMVYMNEFFVRSNSLIGLNFTACPLSLSVYNTTVEQKKLKDLTVQALNITTQMLDITNSPGSYLVKFAPACGYVAQDYPFDVLAYIPDFSGDTNITYGETLDFRLQSINNNNLQSCPITLNVLFANGSIAYSDQLKIYAYSIPAKSLWLGTYTTQWTSPCSGWWLYNLVDTKFIVSAYVVSFARRQNCTFGQICDFRLTGTIPKWLTTSNVVFRAIDSQGNITAFSTTYNDEALRTLKPIHYGTHRLMATTNMVGWDLSLINETIFEVDMYRPVLQMTHSYVDQYFNVLGQYDQFNDLTTAVAEFTVTDSKGVLVVNWTAAIGARNEWVPIPYLDTFVMEAKCSAYGLDLSNYRITFTSSLIQVTVNLQTYSGVYNRIFYGSSLPYGATIYANTDYKGVSDFPLHCKMGYNITIAGEQGFMANVSDISFNIGLKIPTLSPGIYRLSLQTECPYNTTGDYIISIYSHNLTITPNYVSYYIPTTDLVLSAVDLNATSTTRWSWSTRRFSYPSSDSIQLIVPYANVSCSGTTTFTLTSTTVDGIPTGVATYDVTPVCFTPPSVSLVSFRGSPLQTMFEVRTADISSTRSTRYSLDFMYGPNNDTIFLGSQSYYQWIDTILPPISSTYGQFRVRVHNEAGDYPFIYSIPITLESYTGDPRVDLKALLAQQSSTFNLTAMVHLLQYSRNALSGTDLTTYISKVYNAAAYQSDYETKAYVLAKLSQITPPTPEQRRTISDYLSNVVNYISNSNPDGGVITSLLNLVDQQMVNNRTSSIIAKRYGDLSLEQLYNMVFSIADITFNGGNCQGATRSYLTNSISILSTTTLSDNLTLTSDPYTMSLQSSVHNSTCKKAALIRWSRDPRSGMSQAVYTVYMPDAISGSVQLHIAGVDINDVNARYSCGYRPTGSSQSWNTADCHMTADGIAADISSSTDFTIYKVVITHTSTDTNALNGDSQGKHPLTKGALAGIIIGSIVGFALLVGLIVFAVYKWKGRNYRKLEMS